MVSPPRAQDPHTRLLAPRRTPPQGDILEDIELIENLEETKRTALDIEDKVRQARLTEASISRAREVYRPVAARGSLLFFLVDGLNALDRCGVGQGRRVERGVDRPAQRSAHPFADLGLGSQAGVYAGALSPCPAAPRVYHYSMANFVHVLVKGMDTTPGGSDESRVALDQRLGQAVDVEQRVALLVRGCRLGQRGVGRGGSTDYCPALGCGWAAHAWTARCRWKHCRARRQRPSASLPVPPTPQVDGTCQAVFNYIAQGLFERHKLIVSTQLCMAVLRARGELMRAKFDVLLRGPKVGPTGWANGWAAPP